MIEWIKHKLAVAKANARYARIPVMDHGDMTHKEFWYMREPEPVLIGEMTGFRAPEPTDRYEIHFDQRDHYSPKYEDPYYDKKYKFSKYGKTRFTHAETVELINWLNERRAAAH